MFNKSKNNEDIINGSKITELDIIDFRTNEKVKIISNRPNDQLKEIQNSIDNLFGNILVSSAFISYLGPFN